MEGTLRRALRSHLTSSISSLDPLPPDLSETEVGCIITPDLSELIHTWGLQGKTVTEQEKVCARSTPDVLQIPQRPASSLLLSSPAS